MNRNQLSFPKKLTIAIMSAYRLSIDVAKRNVTFVQALIDIKMRLFNTQRALNDDFDWTKYPRHYREELKSISRKHSLILEDANFTVLDHKIILTDNNAKPLHPNHRLLYEVIMDLNPNSIQEIGVGAGDHLHNLSKLLPSTKLFGIDRSTEQLQALRHRHPGLHAQLEVVDITESHCNLDTAELSFTQAVLMHISELNNRFPNAVEYALDSTSKQIVLVENWSQHDYLSTFKRLIPTRDRWRTASFHFSISHDDPTVRCMIISQTECKFPALENYDQLLQGKKLLTH
jgi:hypothetical protein